MKKEVYEPEFLVNNAVESLEKTAKKMKLKGECPQFVAVITHNVNFVRDDNPENRPCHINIIPFETPENEMQGMMHRMMMEITVRNIIQTTDENVLAVVSVHDAKIIKMAKESRDELPSKEKITSYIEESMDKKDFQHVLTFNIERKDSVIVRMLEYIPMGESDGRDGNVIFDEKYLINESPDETIPGNKLRRNFFYNVDYSKKESESKNSEKETVASKLKNLFSGAKNWLKK